MIGIRIASVFQEAGQLDVSSLYCFIFQDQLRCTRCVCLDGIKSVKSSEEKVSHLMLIEEELERSVVKLFS